MGLSPPGHGITKDRALVGSKEGSRCPCDIWESKGGVLLHRDSLLVGVRDLQVFYKSEIGHEWGRAGMTGWSHLILAWKLVALGGVLVGRSRRGGNAGCGLFHRVDSGPSEQILSKPRSCCRTTGTTPLICWDLESLVTTVTAE